MLNERQEFTEYAADLLAELTAKAIKLDMAFLSHLIAMAATEATNIDVKLRFEKSAETINRLI